MLSILLTILHVIVALILVLVVLLQTGRRADLAGAFGGGGSQTVFGTRGAATLLSKLTTAAAVVFMITSLALSLVATRRSTGTGTVLPADETGGSRAPLSAPAPTPASSPLPGSVPPQPAPTSDPGAP